jgi:hypothetical protein
VGRPCKVDFAITFEERQKVQLCRAKIAKALHALETDINVIRGCVQRCYFFAQRCNLPTGATIPAFQHLLSELRAHRDAAFRIMRQCDWTAGLVYTFSPSITSR